MESFNDQLTKWQPFFATVAGVAATLAGLLFVALSINRETITARVNRHLLRLARRAFADFIFALFIAIIFLIPAHEARSLAIPLSTLTAFRIGFMVRSIYRLAKYPEGFNVLREYLFQILSVIGLVAASIEISLGHVLVTFYLVPVVAFLLYNASINAWELLLVEKKADEKSVEVA